jgi:hypothetical protein
MMFDYQRNTFVGWTKNTCELFSLKYYIFNYYDIIPSVCPATPSSIQVDGPPGVGTLSDVTHIIPYFTGNSITGYLVSQDYAEGNKSCIKHVSLRYPFYIQTVYGDCNKASYVDGLTVGSDRHGYIYATIINNSIYSLQGNLTNTSLSLLAKNAFSGVNKNALNRILFVKNLLTANGYVKVSGDGHRDILLISDTDGTLKYLYKGTIRVAAKYENPGRLSMYGSVLVLDMFLPNTTYKNYTGTYRGTNASNLGLSNCSYYAFDGVNGYIHYAMFIPMDYTFSQPTGSLLQSRAIYGGSTCLSPCTTLLYNVSDLVIGEWTRSISQSEDYSMTLSRSSTRLTIASDSPDESLSPSMHTKSISPAETQTIPSRSLSASATKSTSIYISSKSRILSESRVSRSSVTLSKSRASHDSITLGMSRTSHGSTTLSKLVVESDTSTHSLNVLVEGSHATLTYQRSPTSSSKYTLSGSKNMKHVTVPGSVSEYVKARSGSKHGTRGIEVTKSCSGSTEATETDLIRVGISKDTFVEQREVSVELGVAVGVAVISSTGSSSAGGRTSAFLAVIRGQCGSMRELEWYENPLRVHAVFFGDVVFTLAVVFVITLLGYCIERRVPRRADLVGMMLKYKGVELGFTLLLYFTSPIIVSLGKYRREWYEVLTVFASLCFYVFGLIALHKEIRSMGTRVCPLTGRKGFYRITDDLCEWDGVPKLLGPLIEGYTTKSGMWIDFLVLFVVSCSTLSEDCGVLGIITVVVNLLYCVFILWKKPLQPLATGYSNISSAFGQSIGILLALIKANEVFILVVTYLSSVVGLIFFLLPVVRFFHEKYRVREEVSDSGSDLSYLQAELLSISSKEM